nr:MAG TPA_asm: hypothetical protein [Caudoviricetes sp.]
MELVFYNLPLLMILYDNNYHKGFDLRLFPDVLRRYLY